MLGAIIGDIVGSVYEFNNIKTKDFSFFSYRGFFTDDSVLTIAVCKALMDCKGNYKKLSKFVAKRFNEYGHYYPDAGYGNSFLDWLQDRKKQPKNSYGNGSAMRVSSVAYFANSIEEVKSLSYKVTAVTHNHEEGIKGAEATAIATYLALNGYSKQEIKKYVEDNYYELNFDYDLLQRRYYFNETCQNTVPQAIYCFLISNNFEDAIRTGISIGGDSDTLCAIIGAIAGAFYGIPEEMEIKTLRYLDERTKKDYLMFKNVVGDKLKIIKNQ